MLHRLEESMDKFFKKELSMEVYCTTTSRLGSFLTSSNGREFIERVLGVCLY